MNKTLVLPLPPPPQVFQHSPEIVRILDKIRFKIDYKDEMTEFSWFAREYSRAYRHHIFHAEFRLTTVYTHYKKAHKNLLDTHESFSNNLITTGSNKNVSRLYWDFESFLQALCSSLDLLARISGTAYKITTPITFTRFCKTAPEHSITNLFREADNRWARRMKSYRDCFVHYTPADTLLLLQIHRWKNGWGLYSAIPSNPQAKDIMRFRHNRQSELLRYMLTTWRHVRAFDKKLAEAIWKEFRHGKYPLRFTNLFTVGSNTARKAF